MDHLQFHYDGNSQFWQPKVSWKNKYIGGQVANGMSFRGRYLVFTTDGWHLMKWLRNLSLFASFIFLPEGITIWMALAAWFINRIGFNITYKLL